MKICPYCEAEIANNARKCKYCGEIVVDNKKIRLCPYCEAEVSDTAKKCKYCGEWLEVNNKENDNNKIIFQESNNKYSTILDSSSNDTSYWKTFGIKLLMFIPNVVLLVILCGLLYSIWGLIESMLPPQTYFYKSELYYQGFTSIIVFDIFLTIIYLFAKTDKKYLYTMKSALIIGLITSIIIYLILFQTHKTKQTFNKMYTYNQTNPVTIELLNYA